MKRQNGAIHRFNNWLIGEPLPVEDFEVADIRLVQHIADFCLFLSLAFLILYFGIGNYLAEMPEPGWWINAVEPWLRKML